MNIPSNWFDSQQANINELVKLQEEFKQQQQMLQQWKGQQQMGMPLATWSSQHSPFGISQDLKTQGEKPKELTMFGEFKQDMKSFIKEHKGLIYSVILFYLVDHFCFDGKFKAKLQEIMHRLIGKVEDKLDKVGAADAR